MRDILFRGKQVNNGEWVYGYYVCVGNQYSYILSGKINIENVCVYLEKIKVIPETVGQYTCLTDKNGKKIFEGDIVSRYGTYIGRKVKATVAYEYGGFWIKTDNDAGVPLSSWVDTTNICEVIGNIHDNPELLEENNA